MLIKSKNFSKQELDQFCDLQRVSFTILEEMAATLKEGQTEKEVARALVLKYREAGVTSFFHLPVVLFGERTALPGNFTVGKFFPKSRALKKNDSVIMDSAPLFKGYMVDTSYSFCFGNNPIHEEMMSNLAQFRDQICDAVNNGESFKFIADKVEKDIITMGYEPVHTKHPGEVLGHRAIKTANIPFSARLQGFDALSLGWFIFKGRLVDSGLGKKSPLWNSLKTSDHKPHDGLWLVEPHAGLGDVGAKWEEILVIENSKAYWLDDVTPHTKQWANIASNKDYRPNTHSSTLLNY